jgi:tetratricopeptide (TPR) repeat protein
MLLEDALNEVPMGDTKQYVHLAGQIAAHYQRAVALNPRYVEAYNALGDLYLAWYYETDAPQGAVGLLTEAQASYTNATHIQPTNRDALLGLTDVYEATGRFADAERIYDALLAVNPQDQEALYSRGWSRLERGAYDGAIADLTIALRHDPKDFETLSAVAYAYAARGDAVGLERTFRQLERANPGRARLLRQLVHPARPTW